jgi:hypothetical protein
MSQITFLQHPLASRIISFSANRLYVEGDISDISCCVELHDGRFSIIKSEYQKHENKVQADFWEISYLRTLTVNIIDHKILDISKNKNEWKTSACMELVAAMFLLLPSEYCISFLDNDSIIISDWLSALKKILQKNDLFETFYDNFTLKHLHQGHSHFYALQPKVGEIIISPADIVAYEML